LKNFSKAVASSTQLQPTSVKDSTVDVTHSNYWCCICLHPQTTGKQSGRLTSPWWDQACGEAIRNRLHARRALERRPMLSNLIEYKRYQAIARNFTVKRKHSYKLEFLSKITCTTPIGVAWRKIRLMRSRYIMPVYPVADDGNLLHTTLAKAICFATLFTNLGRVVRYGLQQTCIIWSLAAGLVLGIIFTSKELIRDLSQMRMTSPGVFIM
jgi:hypothetical protein